MVKAYIRPWLRRDMPDIEAIEEANHEWDARPPEEIFRILCDRNTICLSAEVDDAVVGFMMYELMPRRIHIHALEIHPSYAGTGIAEQCITKLQMKLSEHKRSRLTIMLRDDELSKHIFLRRIGFLCTKMVRNVYDNDETDGYFFEFTFSQLPEAQEVTENLVLDG